MDAPWHQFVESNKRRTSWSVRETWKWKLLPFGFTCCYASGPGNKLWKLRSAIRVFECERDSLWPCFAAPLWTQKQKPEFHNACPCVQMPNVIFLCILQEDFVQVNPDIAWKTGFKVPSYRISCAPCCFWHRQSQRYCFQCQVLTTSRYMFEHTVVPADLCLVPGDARTYKCCVEKWNKWKLFIVWKSRIRDALNGGRNIVMNRCYLSANKWYFCIKWVLTFNCSFHDCWSGPLWQTQYVFTRETQTWQQKLGLSCSGTVVNRKVSLDTTLCGAPATPTRKSRAVGIDWSHKQLNSKKRKIIDYNFWMLLIGKSPKISVVIRRKTTFFGDFLVCSLIQKQPKVILVGELSMWSAPRPKHKHVAAGATEE